jgi:lysophospholipase
MTPQSLILALFYIALSWSTIVVAQSEDPVSLSSESFYAPVSSQCGVRPEKFVREADGLGQSEKRYIENRSKKAGHALRRWLKKVDGSFALKKTPSLALASSGGGYRAMLTGAGVVQALDSRDGDLSTSGLYQALTYHAGLSGGAWLVSSLAANDWDTVGYITEGLWVNALINNSLFPSHIDGALERPVIARDMQAKAQTGFSPVITDVWGRFISYQVIPGDEGGVEKTWSAVQHSTFFEDFEAPFPIITALGVEDINTPICDAADNATQYEFTPYEFGSWDSGVQAFSPTELLGSTFDGGEPVNGHSCFKRYDNIGYIIGTSSHKFNEQCGESLVSAISNGLEPLVKPAQLNNSSPRRNIFAPYPNPFKNYELSPKVSQEDELYLVDGGQGMICSIVTKTNSNLTGNSKSKQSYLAILTASEKS